MSAEVQGDAAARELAQRAFDAPLLLEAGAGTGKTAVLVARIVAWCLGPGWSRAEARLAEPPRASGRTAATGPGPEAVAEEVLRRVEAITFTEAAAAEMAARVSKALQEIEAGDCPVGFDEGALSLAVELRAERARALVGALDLLGVRTIHAWCRRLLAAHPLEAGLHPRFEVDADGQAQAQAAREVLEAALPEAWGAPPDEDHVLLAAAEIGPGDLEQALCVLLGEGVQPEELGDPLSPETLQFFNAELRQVLDAFLTLEDGRIAGATRATSAGPAARQVAELRDRLAAQPPADAEGLARFLEAEPLPAAAPVRKWAGGDFPAGAGIGEDEKEALAEAARALADALKLLEKLDPRALAAAHRVVGRLLPEAWALLRARGVESFGGLLRGARDLLRDNPGVAALERRGRDQLLVDEFQDTDATQCELLAHLALEGPGEERPCLFLVGDPKQSIYGWRNADLRAYEAFRQRLCAAGGQVRSLVVNFRSAPAILEEVERLVAPVMQPEPGYQPPFEDLVASEQTREASGFRAEGMAPVEHWLSLDLDEEGGLDTGGTSRRASEIEAEAVARDLQRLREEEGVDLGEVALLFRSTGDFDLYLDALRRAGIPFVSEREREHYKRRELVEATALVRCVLDPNDHLALLAVLRSPLVGVPDAALVPLWSGPFLEEVGALRGRQPERLARLRSHVAGVVARLPAELPELSRVEGFDVSLMRFLEQLAELRILAEEGDPAEWVQALRLGLLSEATEGARYLGAFRVANLERFFRELAQALEERGGSAAAVASWLRRAGSQEREHREGRARSVEPGAVQVMTIHRAKGLDFDHVYLLQAHKGRGGGERKETRVSRRGDRVDRTLAGLLAPEALLSEAERRRLESCERVRLLYVAATRAKHRLVIAGKRGPGVRPQAESNARLLESRKASPEGLQEALEASAAAGERGFEDAAGVRWVLPTSIPGPTAGRSPESAPAPNTETMRRDRDRLAGLARSARERTARSWLRAASDSGHDTEEESARLYAEPDGPPARHGPAEAERARDVAMKAGTLVHRMLEELEPDELSAPLDTARLDEALEAAGVGAQRAAVRDRTLSIWESFRSGPLAGRLVELGGSVVARELPVLLPPDQAGAEPEGPVGCITGAIDLLYRDPTDGALVVADYKTDAVPEEADLAAWSERYREQGAAYSRAVQQALGLPASPRFELWYLALGQVWSDSSTS